MRSALVVDVLVAGLVVVGCGASSTSLPSAAASASWSTVTTSAPVALLEVAVAERAGRIWVAGGLRTDGTASNEVFIFDPAAATWSRGPTLPDAVHHSSLVSTPDGLVLVGGYVGDALTVATPAVRRLADGATAWTDDVPLPEARAAGAAAFDGTRIVYAGGVKPGGVANEVFARTVGGAWKVVGRLPIAREHLASTSDGAGRTFFLGGRVGGLDRNLATVDLVDGETTRTIGELPTARGGVAAFWWPSLGACLAGGESPGGANPQVECIAADGTLVRLPDLGVARHGIGAAVVDGRAYVLLGGRQPGLTTSDITENLTLP